MYDDDEDYESERITTVHWRFEVSHDLYGVLEFFTCKADAVAHAERWDDPKITGFPPGGVWVYDRMAQRGKPNGWRYLPSGRWRPETMRTLIEDQA